MNILHLTLEKKWFDLIANGKKTTEFREVKPHWTSRLEKKRKVEFDEVHFVNGYGKHRPSMRVEFKELRRLADGNNYMCKNGEFLSGEHYAIMLSRVLETRNYAL